MEASILTQVVLPLSLFIIMWGMGLSLKIDDFTRIVLKPKAVTIGILCQMLMLPLVGFLIVYLFGFRGELAVGLMLLTFCPGGVTSNVICYLFRGDTALSISLTALVSLVAPFSIPLLTLMAMEIFLTDTQEFTIPLAKTIIQLIAITIVPVSIGMFIHKKFPNFSQAASKPVKILSVLILFAIIAAIVADDWDNMAGYFVAAGLATFILNIASLLMGYLVAKISGLEKSQSISISIELGIQNGTMALFVAGSILGSSMMTVPTVTYSLIMFVTGALFGWIINSRFKDTAEAVTQNR